MQETPKGVLAGSVRSRLSKSQFLQCDKHVGLPAERADRTELHVPNDKEVLQKLHAGEIAGTRGLT